MKLRNKEHALSHRAHHAQGTGYQPMHEHGAGGCTCGSCGDAPTAHAEGQCACAAAATMQATGTAQATKTTEQNEDDSGDEPPIDGRGACACGQQQSHDHEDKHDHKQDFQHAPQHAQEKGRSAAPSCGCGCGCGYGEDDEHGHSHDEAPGKLWQLMVGAVLFAATFVFKSPAWLGLGLNAAAYLVLAYPVLISVFRHFNWRTLMDENFLMAVASLGAWAIGDAGEAVAVMLFFRVGEAFQARAVSGANKSIDSLLQLRADIAHVVRDGVELDVVPGTVQVGETISIRHGEKVPLDCTLLSERTELDTAALTGESLPQGKVQGEMMLAGSLNVGGVITATVLRDFAHSEVQKIVALTREAQAHKAPAEQFITKFARVYTPIVLGLAVAICVIPVLLGGEFGFYAHKALSFLVVSCPCALVISVPMAYFAGIGMASRRGLLIKGGEHMAALANAKTVVMDKTGTLTKGTFSVVDNRPVDGDEQALLALCAALEGHSNHPVAQSIVLAARAQGLSLATACDVEEIAGEGVLGTVDGARIAVGNARLMDRVGVAVENEDAIGTLVFCAQDGVYRGRLVVADTLRDDAQQTVATLRALGVQEIAMLTGDGEGAAKRVAKQVGMDSVRHSLLPRDKWTALATFKNHPVLFVGDGVNDAPVLAAADAGVAMGGIGQDAAIQSADMVLMTDRLMSLCDGRRVAKRTGRTVVQNIVFAIGVKVLVLILAAITTVPIYLAVFADVGVALLCVLNAALVLRMKGFDKQR